MLASRLDILAYLERMYTNGYKRYNRRDLSTLESRSRRPKHMRAVQYDIRAVNTIRKIRQKYPSFSAVKVSVILLRDYAIALSSATVGRIIRKFNLFFSKAIALRKNLSKSAARGWQTRRAKERMRYYLKPDHPRHIIEFDMKHIKNGGVKQYAICAIDAYTKEALIHISSSCTAKQDSVAMQKVLDRFGTNIAIVCDNGSENFGATFNLLANSNVRQIFARPHMPKDKPHIENFIGKYQKE